MNIVTLSPSSSTYQMGLMAQTFNEKLDDRNKKFTFFVPRDKV